MAKASTVTDEMFVAASQASGEPPQAARACCPATHLVLQLVPMGPCLQALADCVTEEQLQAKQMYPNIKDLREVSAKVDLPA